MPTFEPIQPSFSSGEVSPKVWGRVDIARYDTAVETLENFVIMPQGGIYRRPATNFIAAAKYNNRDARLFEFIYNTVQAYAIEYGHQYIRLFANEAPVQGSEAVGTITNGTFTSNITGWSAASSTAPGTATWDSGDGGRAKLDNVSGTGVAKMSQTLGGMTVGKKYILRFKIKRDQQGDGGAVTVTCGGSPFTDLVCKETGWYTIPFIATATTLALTFQLTVGAAWYAYVDSVDFMPAGVFELPTDIQEADLWTFTSAQSNDVMFFCAPSYAPKKLSRLAADQWTFTDINFLDGPYLTQNTDTANTIAPSATSGVAITLTSIKDTFVASDVGRFIRILHSSTWGYAKITGFTDTKHVTAEVLSNFGAATAQAAWRFGTWGSAVGYPQLCDFFQQRLVFGNSTSQPTTLWFSSTGVFFDMTPTKTDGTVLATNAIYYSIYSNTVDAIAWMSSGTNLLVGTRGGEWVVTKATTTEGFSPTNIDVKRQTKHGSRVVRAIQASNSTLFVQRSGRRIYEMLYNIQLDSYDTNEMTLLAEHVLPGGTYVRDVCYQTTPDGVLWVATSDGFLVAMTYLREQQIVGWHRHWFGGEDVLAKSLCAIPTPDGNSDQVWLLLERVVNGSTVKYIELMDQPFYPTNVQDKTSMSFLDCYVKYDGAMGVGLTLSAVTGSGVTVTASAPFFDNTMVGRKIHYRYLDNDEVEQISRATITAYTDSTHVTVTVNSDFPSTSLAAAGCKMTATQFTGADHMAGDTAWCVADGGDVGAVEIDGSGNFTLPVPASVVFVGYLYYSLLQTLRIDGGNPIGTGQGKKKKLHSVTARLWNSLTFKHGPSLDKLTVEAFRDTTDPMDRSPPLFTGDKDVVLEGEWDLAGQYWIVQDKPYPLSILALMPKEALSP